MTLDIFRNNLRSPRTIGLYDAWRVRVSDYLIPYQTDFSAADLAEWASNLLLIKVRERTQFSYGLYGTSFRDAFGVDMTGADIDSLPAEQAAILKAEYKTVVTNKRPMWRIYTAWFGEELQTWERLTLPLANSRREVSLIMASAYRLPQLHQKAE